MLRSLLLAVLIVVGIAAAPQASADTNGYLKTLSDNGINPTDQNQQQQLVNVGKAICQQMHSSGASPSAEASRLASTLKVSQSVATTVVNAAATQLC
jgi:hypothetical protein